jgi:radical SAM superfamily enzyme YgiQ (UPF0313 family)
LASRIKNVVLLQPRSSGGNFEYVAIPRQGMLFLSSALHEHQGPFVYDRVIWFEDRCGRIDPDKDLEGVDLLLLTALVNETPRAYEIARLARQYHPSIKILGGGPQMGPLPAEAFEQGDLDVVVQREAEDIIGDLCDLLLTYEGDDLTRELHKLDGIAFRDGGVLVQKPFRRMIAPDLVELPDFASIRGLTTANPMAAGVLETSRGCTESCTYCEVIQQFVGYRRIGPDVEIKRLHQLMRMAEDGLIHRSPIDGRFPVFISDDLHSPPKRAVKYRDERLARARNWRSSLLSEGIDPEKQFFFISQNRAELGSDPEMMDAFWGAGMRMLYLGVESSSAENLKLVNKRQDPDQMEKDLTRLNEYGYQVVAMTIIGLPYDDEDSIMDLATWVTQKHISRFQTANLLTPLPATVNWPTLANGAMNLQGLQLLNREGGLLNGNGIPAPGGELPPYDLYTGKQFVHYDRRWTLQESQALYQRYTARLRPIDKVYERIFRSMRHRAERTGEAVPVRV